MDGSSGSSVCADGGRAHGRFTIMKAPSRRASTSKSEFCRIFRESKSGPGMCDGEDSRTGGALNDGPGCDPSAQTAGCRGSPRPSPTRQDGQHTRAPRRPRVTQLSPVPVTRAAVRWSLGHALPSTLLQRAAKQGDLHGRMFVATQSSDLEELEPILDELRTHRPFYQGKYASVSADNAAVRALLSNPDAGSAVMPAGRGGPPGAAAGLVDAGRAARPAHPALAAGDRAAGPHPLPQARLSRLQRPGGREAAWSHPADRRRAPRQDRPEQPGRHRLDVLQPAARHRDRGDPRRPGSGPREGAPVRRRGRAEPRPRALLAGVPPCRGGAARVRRVAGAPPRPACVGTRATTCSASSSPPRRTAWVSPTPS